MKTTHLVAAIAALALLTSACTSSTDSSTPSQEPTDTATEPSTAGTTSSSAESSAPTESVTLNATQAFLGPEKRIWYQIALEGPDAYKAHTAHEIGAGQGTAYNAIDIHAPTLIEDAADYENWTIGELLPLSQVAHLSDSEALALLEDCHATWLNADRADSMPANTYFFSGGVCRVQVGTMEPPIASAVRIEDFTMQAGGSRYQSLVGMSWPQERLTELSSVAYASSANRFVNLCATSEDALRGAVANPEALDPLGAVPAVRVDYFNEFEWYEVAFTDGLVETIEIDGVRFGGYQLASFDGPIPLAIVTKIDQPTTFILDATLKD